MENFRRSRSVEQINQILSIKSNYYFFKTICVFVPRDKVEEQLRNHEDI